jgi:hypothetical protein
MSWLTTVKPPLRSGGALVLLQDAADLPVQRRRVLKPIYNAGRMGKFNGLQVDENSCCGFFR